MKLIDCAWIWTILIICGIFKARAQIKLDKLDLQNQLPQDILKPNINYNDIKDVLHNNCIKVAGEELGNQAFNNIESGVAVLTECINNIVNFTTMQQEIHEASPLGELDVVFNKYCTKRSIAIGCFDDFMDKLLPCLDKDEQEIQNVIKRIVESLLNFVCYKDGDQIALFIAEEGPECLESQKDNIEQCLNNTFSTFVNHPDNKNMTDTTIKTFPKLVFGEQECGDMKTLENCIVRHLEHCSKITPANLVESMFNFIRNETLCRNFQHSALTDDTNSLAPSNFAINSLLYIVLIIIAVFKMY